MKTGTRRAPYVDAVGRHLLDVPWTRRQEILDDLERHLRESAVDNDELAAWTNRFGAPSEYARQLRDALGLATDDNGLAHGRRWHVRTATRRTKVLIVVVVLVFAAIIGGVLGAVRWMATLQPFSFGNLLAMPGHRSTEAGNHTEFRWTFRKGEGFAVGTQLFNDGPVAVRVTDLGPWLGGGDAPTGLPWGNWRVTLGLREDPSVGPSGDPFRSFTLDPGEGQWIFIEGDFVECPEHFDVGTSAGLDAIPVTFEVFGFERHETLDLGFTYTVEVGRECAGVSDEES